MQLLVMQIQAMKRMGRLLDGAVPEEKQGAQKRAEQPQEKETKTPSEGRERR